MQRADSLEKTLMLGKTGGRRRGQQMIRWLVGIIDSKVMSLNKLREIVRNRETWHITVHGVTKSRTWLSYWTKLNWTERSWSCHIERKCLSATFVEYQEDQKIWIKRVCVLQKVPVGSLLPYLFVPSIY